MISFSIYSVFVYSVSVRFETTSNKMAVILNPPFLNQSNSGSFLALIKSSRRSISASFSVRSPSSILFSFVACLRSYMSSGKVRGNNCSSTACAETMVELEGTRLVSL